MKNKVTVALNYYLLKMDSVSVGKQLETLLAELKNIRTDIGSMNLRFDRLDQKLNNFISKTEVDIADVRKDVNQF